MLRDRDDEGEDPDDDNDESSKLDSEPSKAAVEQKVEVEPVQASIPEPVQVAVPESAAAKIPEQVPPLAKEPAFSREALVRKLRLAELKLEARKLNLDSTSYDRCLILEWVGSSMHITLLLLSGLLWSASASSRDWPTPQQA